MRAGSLAPLLALLTACAVPSTGVVPEGAGNYTVTRQGSSALASTTDLTAAASTEAATYCEAKGKNFKRIYVKEAQARPFGGWPESVLLFRCD